MKSTPSTDLRPSSQESWALVVRLCARGKKFRSGTSGKFPAFRVYQRPSCDLTFSMKKMLPRKPNPNRVFELFREGYNTYDIARMLLLTEPVVMRLLLEAREARRVAKADAPLSPQRKPPVEGQ